MHHWYEGDVLSSGINVHYYRTGIGTKPALLLAHGFTDNGLCWSRTADALSADFDVVMVDARNHGMSGTGPADVNSLAEDLATVVTKLKLGPANALGHSVGANVVTALAADYPQLVARLVLEDPPWRSATKERDTKSTDAEAAAKKATSRDLAFRKLVARMAKFSDAEMLQLGQKQHPSWSAQDYAPWGLSNRQVSADARALLTMGDWQSFAQRVACPSLLIHADASLGGIVTPETAQFVQQLNPCFTAVRVRHAGHNIRRENFTDYIASVASFLSAT
ncbi:MAG: alpha/beta hydrolase [Gammaproteobacteria bacterium]|jgi:N-formylmaleamate deformylase